MNKLLQRTIDGVMYIIGVIFLFFAWAFGAVLVIRRTIDGEKKIVGRLRWFKYRPVRSNKP